MDEHTLKEDRIAKFLFHFGKATWKLIPGIGPFVDELFYEQYKDILVPKLNNLSSKDIERIESIIPKYDFEKLETIITNLGDELKKNVLDNILCQFSTLEEDHEEILFYLEKVNENAQLIPNILEIIDDLKNEAQKTNSLKQALDNLELKRENWINRISFNQRNFLSEIPNEYTSIDILWEKAKQIIPDCGYKEFRFRLHELEWLCLVTRKWDNKWFYKNITKQIVS